MRAAPGLYPVREIVPPDTGAAFMVMAGPYGLTEDELEDGEAWFVDRVDRELRPGGYRLAGTFAPGADLPAAVVGFRLIRSNAWGDHLWIDDLLTGGIGAENETLQLLSFLKAEARQLGLTRIYLDVCPDEPAEDGSEGAVATGLAAVQDLDDLPDSGRPFIDRRRAALNGFREVAGRFVMEIGDGDASAPTDQKAPSNSRHELGRHRLRGSER